MCLVIVLLGEGLRVVAFFGKSAVVIALAVPDLNISIAMALFSNAMTMNGGRLLTLPIEILGSIVKSMGTNHSIDLVDDNQTVTTSAAAEYIGITGGSTILTK